jgi:hypothetical protein
LDGTGRRDRHCGGGGAAAARKGAEEAAPPLELSSQQPRQPSGSGTRARVAPTSDNQQPTANGQQPTATRGWRAGVGAVVGGQRRSRIGRQERKGERGEERQARGLSRTADRKQEKEHAEERKPPTSAHRTEPGDSGGLRTGETKGRGEARGQQARRRRRKKKQERRAAERAPPKEAEQLDRGFRVLGRFTR